MHIYVFYFKVSYNMAAENLKAFKLYSPLDTFFQIKSGLYGWIYSYLMLPTAQAVPYRMLNQLLFFWVGSLQTR